jgi:predicted protein tyrosine phosphatase
MRILFVCSRNRLRSPTAEAVLTGVPGVETASAGTSPDADNPLSLDLVEWADVIFVMENVHRKRLNETFKAALRNKKIVVLGIADRYGYRDQALVEILQTKLARYLGGLTRERLKE